MKKHERTSRYSLQQPLMLSLIAFVLSIGIGSETFAGTKPQTNSSKPSISRANSEITAQEFKSEVPPPLLSLLRSLGRLKFGVEFANFNDGKTIDDDEVIKRLSAKFELSESVLIEIADQDRKMNEIEKSLIPTIRIGESGLTVSFKGDLKTNGVVNASLDFFHKDQASRLPVIVKNERMGELLLSLKSLKWSAKGIDPTQNVLSQYIDLSVDCQIASKRTKVAGAWSEIPCSGSIQYDPNDKKWYFKIQIKPEKLENIVSPEGLSCPQDTKAIATWMTSILSSFNNDKTTIPSIIDHPLGGDIMALGRLDSDPHKEYFSNFLVQIEKDEIYLGPKAFGIVLKIPSSSWILVCGDTRLSNPNPFIDISFFKIKSAFLRPSKKWVEPGPIRVRWRPLSGAADSINNITQDVPLISDFFRLIRDVTAPVQDYTISALGGYDVDKIRLSRDGFKFTSSGRILETIKFNGNRSIDTKAFEQYLLPDGTPNDNP